MADYYHVAPTTERNRIQQHGLQPSQPMNNPAWGPQDTWERRHPEGVPMGVYGWPSSGQAYNYAEQLENARDTPHDVWRIPDDPARAWGVDPDISMQENRQPRFTDQPVMNAELLEGPEDRVWDYDNQQAYENQWHGFRPLNLNAQKPGYEDLWQQRVGE